MGHFEWSRASFLGSLVPMVIANGERRFVAANPAACLLLRLSEEDVVRLRIDDLTPPEARENMDALWEAFLRAGVQEGTFELMMPDGARIEVEYSATANVEPGLHLSILMFPAGDRAHRSDPSQARPTLTEREREVLGMVAGGRGTSWIAAELNVSSSTVETHVRHVLEKLDARNRAHAISLGLQRGEISLDLGSVHPRYWG
ncbi:MAG TPA: LuxR C-terminal-related transcriptional regulator [Solirubrobacteraceae bacterium]|nr:LuxR C-terminal-related transcriptional regulator [Solirubrobacteraceae bacterium]